LNWVTLRAPVLPLARLQLGQNEAARWRVPKHVDVVLGSAPCLVPTCGQAHSSACRIQPSTPSHSPPSTLVSLSLALASLSSSSSRQHRAKLPWPTRAELVDMLPLSLLSKPSPTTASPSRAHVSAPFTRAKGRPEHHRRRHSTSVPVGAHGPSVFVCGPSSQGRHRVRRRPPLLPDPALIRLAAGKPSTERVFSPSFSLFSEEDGRTSHTNRSKPEGFSANGHRLSGIVTEDLEVGLVVR
jgi:hypothetical protein